MMDKQRVFRELARSWLGCEKCRYMAKPFGRERLGQSLGKGHPDADIVVVYDHPTAEEERSGEPLDGRLRGVVENVMMQVGIVPEEVFFTPIVACRPTHNKRANEFRRPSAAEVRNCSTRLHRLIHVVDPYVIVTMGRQAWEAVTGDKGADLFKRLAADTEQREKAVMVPGLHVPAEYSLIPTYHPLDVWDRRNDVGAKSVPQLFGESLYRARELVTMSKEVFL